MPQELVLQQGEKKKYYAYIFLLVHISTQAPQMPCFVVSITHLSLVPPYITSSLSCLFCSKSVPSSGGHKTAIVRVSWDKVREWHGHIYTTKCKIDSQWEAAAQHREISSVLCDHLEGWDRDGGRETQEGGDMGIYVYVQLIHFVIKQKLTHHCKAIILQ